MDIAVEIKFVILTAFTFAGSLLAFHLLIRPLNFIRPLFGLKLRPAKKKEWVAEP
jgi:hypothetical protein